METYSTIAYIMVCFIVIMYSILDCLAIGGIFYRPNAEGKMVFTPKNFFLLWMEPLYSAHFWTMKNLWSSNYMLLLIVGLILMFLLLHYYRFKGLTESQKEAILKMDKEKKEKKEKYGRKNGKKNGRRYNAQGGNYISLERYKTTEELWA